MIFKTAKGKLIDVLALLSLLLLVACNSEDETNVISQHLQAHQSEIVSIEISANQELILRTNQSLQFQAYGLLEDGTRLQTEADIDGNTSDQTINDLVVWSVDDTTFAQISEAGRLSGAETAGSVTVIATFAGSEASASVIITDAVLTDIIIDTTVTEVEVCRNLELTATGVLEDGNEITFTGETIIWRTENNDPDNEVGEFKNEAIGELSTFLSGSVIVTAEDSSGEVISSDVSITVTGGIESITLSNTAENTLNVGDALEISATGLYPDGEFDITENSVFVSRDEDLATFAGNVLTAKTDVEDSVVEITASCDFLVGELEINIINP
jgi:hypothetical protein